jgi:hypothetical protein
MARTDLPSGLAQEVQSLLAAFHADRAVAQPREGCFEQPPLYRIIVYDQN